MGFTGYWQTDKNGEVYHDVAINGFDVYDGLDVPMVAKTKDNRLILSGWVGSIEWASVIVHRELIQGENGRLFMKWLPELAPKTRLSKSMIPYSHKYSILVRSTGICRFRKRSLGRASKYGTFFFGKNESSQAVFLACKELCDGIAQ